MRGVKRVVLIGVEQYENSWPPTGVEGCIAWFAEKLARIPEEHRPTATVDISSVGGYEDGHCANIEICYTRPETDEEVNDREDGERRRVYALEAKERQMLVALKAKYGDGK